MSSRDSSARQEPKDIDGSGEAGERFTLAGGKSLIARGGKVDAEAEATGPRQLSAPLALAPKAP